jgi:uncharacterized membrane protein YcaP (DUF421 family)
MCVRQENAMPFGLTFHPGVIIDNVVRSAMVYLAILAALRTAGKRHVAQLSIVDFVLVLLVSNAVQNAMVGDDNTLPGGLAAAFTLVAINVLLTRLVLRNERLGYFLEGEPTLLVRNGQVLDNHLQRECIRRSELEAAIREHGFRDVSCVKQAILEIDGSISVVPYNDHPEERRLPPLRRHRRVGRRGYRPGQE